MKKDMTHNRSVLEQKKLAELYQRYGHIVLRVCRDILRNEDDAQDALQESFLKFWRYMDQLRNPGETLTVLKRTALSCSIDSLRARGRRGRYYESWQQMQQVFQSEGDANRADEQLALRQLITSLLRDVRVDTETIHMVYLYYFDDMTLEEVAMTTGYSRRSVGMKLDRFREQAQKYCRNQGLLGSRDADGEA